MKRAKSFIFTLVCVLTVPGCGVPGLFGLVGQDPRTTDGGGGDLVSAGLKVMRGALTSLTQDEVQLLSDEMHGVIGLLNPNVNLTPMTNEQADAFIAFLQANSLPGSPHRGLQTLNDLRQFAELALSDPNLVVFPPGFLEAFADQINVVDISELDLDVVFGSVFGGS